MNREKLLAMMQEPLRQKIVTVNGCDYCIREMTEEQGTEYELELQSKDGKFDFSKSRRLLISKMLVDDSGNLIVESESELKRMPRSVAGALYEECLQLNRYDAKEVKALVKNFEGASDSD